MADIHWTGYIGMATGIFGAILSVVSYRKANSTITLQMRLGLKKSISDLGANIQITKELIEEARSSKRSIDAATKRLSTGGHKQWINDADNDFLILTNIEPRYPIQGKKINKYKANELEEFIHNTHNYSRTVNNLNEKYKSSLIDDKKRADQHRVEFMDSLNRKNDS